MSFRERSAWISLATHAVVFGGYFSFLTQAWDARYGQGLSVALLVLAVLAFIVIFTALTIVSALATPNAANAPADERETMIDLKAERFSSYAVSFGVVCLIGALLMGWSGILVANLLLATLVIAELVKAGAQILYFRAGA